MAISGYVLKSKERFSMEKTKNDIRSIALKLNLYLSEEPAECDEESGLSYMQWCVYDEIAFNLDPEDWGDEDVNQGEWMSLYIYSLNDKYESDGAFDWVKEAGKLHKAIRIEDIEGKEEMLFDFVHEYMELNPEDYFWNENDWVYTLDDMKQLKQLLVDSNWCYRKPSI